MDREGEKEEAGLTDRKRENGTSSSQRANLKGWKEDESE